jgi:hypothetical protein
MFCFGTISSITDEDGILHRIADPPKEKFSSEIPRKVGTRQQIAQPPVPRAKTTSCKPRIENSPARRTLLPTSPTKEWTRITRKKEASIPRKGTEVHRVIFPASSPSKEDRKELATTTTVLLSTQTSSSSGEDWNHLPSLTTSQPCQEKNLPSEKLSDKGTDVGIFDDITKLGSGTQRSPYLRMKSRKWEKLPTNGYSEKGGILADVTAGKLKTKIENKLNRAQGYAERTLSLLET